MTLPELIGLLTPLATKLIGEIFKNRKRISRGQAREKLIEIQRKLRSTKYYLLKVEIWRKYLDVYLRFGSLAERIADIAVKIRILDRDTSKNISLFNVKDKEDIPKIGEIVRGGKRFAFQQFVPGDTLDKTFNTVKPYATAVVASFADTMKKYVTEVVLRV